MTHISRSVQLIPLFSPTTMHTSRHCSPPRSEIDCPFLAYNVRFTQFFLFSLSSLPLFPSSTLPRGLRVAVVISTRDHRNFHLDVCLGSSILESGAHVVVDDGYNNCITTTRTKPARQIVTRARARALKTTTFSRENRAAPSTITTTIS